MQILFSDVDIDVNGWVVNLQYHLMYTYVRYLRILRNSYQTGLLFLDDDDDPIIRIDYSRSRVKTSSFIFGYILCIIWFLFHSFLDFLLVHSFNGPIALLKWLSLLYEHLVYFYIQHSTDFISLTIRWEPELDRIFNQIFHSKSLGKTKTKTCLVLKHHKQFREFTLLFIASIEYRICLSCYAILTYLYVDCSRPYL